MQKKHILYVHHGKGIGGAPISLRNLVESIIKENRYKITVLFLFDTEAVSLFDHLECNKIILNKPYFYFNHTSRWAKAWKIHVLFLMVISWVYTVLYRAPKILKSLKPDLVHLNSSVLTDWSFVCQNLGIKNIIHIREAISFGHFGIRYRIIKNMLSNFPNARIFISQENIQRLGWKADMSSLVVYNDVGENFKNIEKLQKDNMSTLNVLFLGGLSPIKGINTVVKSIPFISDNVIIHICGHFNKTTIFKKHPELDNPKIKIIGLLKNVSHFMKKMDLLVCPITTTHFCRPVIEASSIGIPTVISDIEGVSEMVLNGHTGLHFKEGDGKDLADKINNLSENIPFVNELGLNAKNRFQEVFSPDKGIKKILSIYKKLL